MTDKTKRRVMTVPRSAMVFRAGLIEDVVEKSAAAADGAEEAAGPRQRTFSLVGNSGGIMQHWLFGAMAIDLDGLDLRSGRVPVLLDHESSRRVGWSTSATLEEGGLVLRGQMLHNEHADEVIRDHQQGFPWQASIRAEPREIEEVEEGATAQVNGFEMAGPGVIFRVAELKEVSFTAVGVDSNTGPNEIAAAADGPALSVPVRPSEGHHMTESKTDPVQPPIDTDAVRAEGRTAGLADGVKLANERAGKILKAAAQAGVPTEFAAELVAGDKPLEDCLMAILAERPATPARSSSNEPNPDTEGLLSLPAAAANEGDYAKRFDVLKQRFAATPSLHSQFSSAEAYAGYVDGMASGGLQLSRGN